MKAKQGLSLFLAAVILTSGVGVSASVATATPAEAAVTQSQVNTAVAHILKETNANRAKYGLKPLTLSTTLNSVAQNWTKKMGDNGDLAHNPSYFDQYPDGAETGGENVAMGFTYKSIVAGWMASPGHRANILTKDYTHIGIGYYVDSHGKAWFTQNFAGYPTPKAPNIIEDFNSSVWRNGFTAYWWDGELDSQEYKVDVYNGGVLVRSTIVKDPDVIVEGLLGNTSYIVKVTARNIEPLTKKVYSSPVYTTTVKTSPIGIDPEEQPVSAPLPVTYLSADVAGYDADKAGISWDVPDDYSGFLNFYIVTLKAAGQPDRVIKTRHAGVEVTGLKMGTTYTANVQAQIVGYDNQETRLTPNKIVTFKTAADPNLVKVANVTSLKALTTSDTTMTVSWKAPTGTIGKLRPYTVLINQGSKTVKRYVTTGTSYKVTGLAPGTSYTAHVIAQAVSGNGLKQATSKAASANFYTTKVTVAKSAKPSTKVTTTSSNVTATWTKPAVTGKLVNYTVTLKQGTKVIKGVTTTGLRASFSGLKENTTYTVDVRANVISANNKNKGSATTVVTGKTKLTAASTVKVSKPSSLKVTVGRTSVTTTYKKPAVTGKIKNYTVVVKQGKKYIKTVTTTSTKSVISGLRANNTYTVYVKANATSSNGKYKASSAYVYKTVKTKR